MMDVGAYIYTPRPTVAKLSPPARLAAAGLAIACALVLGQAARMTPDPSGVGTHTAMGLESCQFLLRTGVPCPTCGMTTSFAHFVRGNLLASVYVQPMGTVLAFATAMAFWAGFYLAITGRPALRLIQILQTRYYLTGLMIFGLIGWGWKVFIHLRGIDGW